MSGPMLRPEFADPVANFSHKKNRCWAVSVGGYMWHVCEPLAREGHGVNIATVFSP